MMVSGFCCKFAQKVIIMSPVFRRESEANEWPDLDVDFELDSLCYSERYPLVMKRDAMDIVQFSKCHYLFR